MRLERVNRRVIPGLIAAGAILFVQGCSKPEPGSTEGGSSGAVPPSPSVTVSAAAELAKLPTPAGVKQVFVNDDVAMYSTEASPQATTDECRKRLLQEGWEPYGGAGNSRYYKRGLTRLIATVGTAAQDNKTIIQYSQTKLPVDLPAPAFAEGVEFSETTKQLSFRTSKSLDEVISYYLEALKPDGWKATTDQPIRTGVLDQLIFRNPEMEVLTLGVSEYNDQRRVSLRHESAEEFAAAEKRFQEEMKRREAEANAALPKVTVNFPSAATKFTRTKGRTTFSLPAGGAKEYVERLRRDFSAVGWKERVTTIEKVGGLVTFTKDEQTVTVSYTDPGIVSADVTLLTTGVEINDDKKDEK